MYQYLQIEYVNVSNEAVKIHYNNTGIGYVVERKAGLQISSKAERKSIKMR